MLLLSLPTVLPNRTREALITPRTFSGESARLFAFQCCQPEIRCPKHTDLWHQANMSDSPDDILQDTVAAILRFRPHNPEAPATIVRDDETVHELPPSEHKGKGTVETSRLLPGIQLEPPSLGYDRCTATCDNSEIHVVRPVSTTDRLIVQIDEFTHEPRRHSLTRSPTFYIETDKGPLSHGKAPMDEPYGSLPSDDASDAKDGSFVFSTPRSSVYPSDPDSSPYLAATAQDRDADVRGVGVWPGDAIRYVGMIHTIGK